MVFGVPRNFTKLLACISTFCDLCSWLLVPCKSFSCNAAVSLPVTTLLALLGGGAEGHSHTCSGSLEWGGPNAAPLVHATMVHAFAPGSCPFRQNKCATVLILEVRYFVNILTYIFDGSLEPKLRGIQMFRTVTVLAQTVLTFVFLHRLFIFLCPSSLGSRRPRCEFFRPPCPPKGMQATAVARGTLQTLCT